MNLPRDGRTDLTWPPLDLIDHLATLTTAAAQPPTSLCQAPADPFSPVPTAVWHLYCYVYPDQGVLHTLPAGTIIIPIIALGRLNFLSAYQYPPTVAYEITPWRSALSSPRAQVHPRPVHRA